MVRPDRHRTMVLATDTPPLDTRKLRYDYNQIEAAHRQQVMDVAVQIHQQAARAKESLLAIGKQLLTVKELLPHGAFEAWLRIEFNLSVRMAQNMMNVAREYGDKSETVSLFSDSVLYLLASPSTSPEVRTAIEEQALSTGRSPTRSEVKRIKRELQPPPLAPAKVVYVEPEATPTMATVSAEAATTPTLQPAQAIQMPTVLPSTESSPTTDTTTTLPGRAYSEIHRDDRIAPEWITYQLTRGMNIEHALRNVNASQCLQALAAIPITPHEQKRRALIEARLEQLQWANEVTAALPTKLLQVGYSITLRVEGQWQWQHDWGKGKIHIGEMVENATLAVEAALENYHWQVAQGHIKLPHATTVPSAAPPAAPQPTVAPATTALQPSTAASSTKPLDPRMAQAQALRQRLRQARDAAKHDYGDLTGLFSHVAPLERAIEPMLVRLNSLITALGGDDGA